MVRIIISLGCLISVWSISASSHPLPLLSPSAKPQNSASTVTVIAGTKQEVVARCESKDGRPAAQLSWVTTANGNATTVSKPGGDNTVTVTSEYRMVPTAADNGKDISCVVNHRTQVKPESYKMKLAVQCKNPSTHTHTTHTSFHGFRRLSCSNMPCLAISSLGTIR